MPARAPPRAPARRAAARRRGPPCRALGTARCRRFPCRRGCAGSAPRASGCRGGRHTPPCRLALSWAASAAPSMEGHDPGVGEFAARDRHVVAPGEVEIKRRDLGVVLEGACRLLGEVVEVRGFFY